MKVFVARQPIFNRKEDVFAYELLYRNDTVNEYPLIDGDQATAEVIVNSFFNIGIDELSNGKICFINFTENLLYLKLPTYFSPEKIVVEILETVVPTREIVETVKELKGLGYQIALDDFILIKDNPYLYDYLQYADIIKVDFLQSDQESRAQIERLAKKLKIKLLAEKLETREAFEQAKESGYDYFQGYFFSKPTIVTNHDIPSYFHSYVEIINYLSTPEPEVRVITQLIERDLSLTYKLLKLINTLAYRRRDKIQSVSQAIMLLGFIELKKRLYVLAVREKSMGNSDLLNELVLTSMTRAKTCEAVGRNREPQSVESGYFMVGMFSLLDTLLGVPMEKLLSELPLSDEICDALKGKENDYKKVLDLVLDVEKGDWSAATAKCQVLHLDESTLLTYYRDSLSWSNELLT